MKDDEEKQTLLANKNVNYTFKRQLSVVLASTFGNFLTGYAAGFSGPAGQNLLFGNATDIYGESIALSYQEVSWMTSLLALGTFASSLFAGQIMEGIGRKLTLSLVIGLSFFIGSLCIFLAYNPAMILIGRFITGLGCGIQFAIIGVYLLETCTTECRSGFIGYIIVMEFTGTMVTFMLSIWLDWKYLALTCAIFSLMFSIGIWLFAIESPVWQLKREEKENCIKTVQWLSECDDAAVESLIEEIVKPQLKEEKISWTEVKLNWKTVLASTVFNSGFTFIGFKLIEAYPNTILALMDIDMNSLSKITFAFGIAGVVGSVVSIELTKKFKRRPLLIHTTMFLAICLASLAALYALNTYHYLVLAQLPSRSFIIDNGSTSESLKWLPPVIIFSYLLVGNLGIVSLCWPVTVEILPPHLRPIVNSYVTSINHLIAFVSLKTFIGLVGSINLSGTLLLYTATCLMYGFFIIFYVPETKYSI